MMNAVKLGRIIAVKNCLYHNNKNKDVEFLLIYNDSRVGHLDIVLYMIV